MLAFYRRYWINCVNFQGRARRREFWYPFLCNAIVLLALVALANVWSGFVALGSFYGLVSLLPGLSVAIRRLHDLGRPGWWLLLGLVPLGGIVLLAFYCMDSVSGENEYGQNPKGI